MSKVIRAERRDPFLFPPTLDELIHADHLARFIDMTVKHMDFEDEDMEFQILKEGSGHPKYDENILISLYLYAYYKKITSFREIEELAKNDVGAMWLTGMHYPDHNTLWRFYHRNHKGLKNMFKKTVKMSMKMGLVGLALQAVDGTKITADASKQKALHEKDLEYMLKRLDEAVAKYMTTLEKSRDKSKTRPSVKIPRALKGVPLKDVVEHTLAEMNTEEKIALKEEIEEELKELKKAGTKHLSPTDPDARMMKNHEGTRFAYNAQIAVDSKSGIIISQDVTNRADDSKELPGMIDKTVKNTGVSAGQITTVADGGYAASAGLVEVDEKGFNVL